MRPYLPDVNLLLALAWTCHPMHRRALSWMAKEPTRPVRLSEINTAGFIRISAEPAAFERPRSFADSERWLTEFSTHREMRMIGWSAGAAARLRELLPKIQGHRQISDVVLLALAKSHDCALATLDRKLPHLDPAQRHLEIIPPLPSET